MKDNVDLVEELLWKNRVKNSIIDFPLNILEPEGSDGKFSIGISKGDFNGLYQKNPIVYVIIGKRYLEFFDFSIAVIDGFIKRYIPKLQKKLDNYMKQNSLTIKSIYDNEKGDPKINYALEYMIYGSKYDSKHDKKLDFELSIKLDDTYFQLGLKDHCWGDDSSQIKQVRSTLYLLKRFECAYLKDIMAMYDLLNIYKKYIITNKHHLQPLNEKASIQLKFTDDGEIYTVVYIYQDKYVYKKNQGSFPQLGDSPEDHVKLAYFEKGTIVNWMVSGFEMPEGWYIQTESEFKKKLKDMKY